MMDPENRVVKLCTEGMDGALAAGPYGDMVRRGVANALARIDLLAAAPELAN